MKDNIHPEFKECEVACACGNKFKTQSVKEVLEIEVCSACHPFYTEQQGKAAKRGKVEKFRKKYGIQEDE